MLKLPYAGPRLGNSMTYVSEKEHHIALHIFKANVYIAFVNSTDDDVCIEKLLLNF